MEDVVNFGSTFRPRDGQSDTHTSHGLYRI